MQGKNKIGIIGLGLIGGSIARSLKRNGRNYILSAWDKDKEMLDQARRDGVIDCAVENLESGFQDIDILFFCVPVYAMKSILQKLLPSLSPGCILSDVGSTKGDVLSLVKELDLEKRFIGGHPLAGSEKSGYPSSKANLFENAYYCITPTESSSQENLDDIKTIINDMGAIPLVLSSEEHDRATAAISHVPHVVAALLVNMVGHLDGPENHMKTLAAGGFKDITRIASSSPELWAGICLSNREVILNTLASLENLLHTFEKDLKEGEQFGIQSFFKSARTLRDTFSERKSFIQKTFDILVDVDDRPGIIAVIASALANENINIKNIGILNNRETEEGALEIQFENEDSRELGIKALTQLGYKAKKKE